MGGFCGASLRERSFFRRERPVGLESGAFLAGLLGSIVEALGDAAMISFTQLAPFVLACVALVAVPGPAVAYLVTRSLEEGKSVGVRSAAGVAAGNFGHALLAAFGVSAIFASSELAFDLLKYVGAAYLIYLGARRFAAGDAKSRRRERRGRRGSVFLEGATVGILNPKVALFLMAFLPQFADAEQGRMWLQLLGLGTLFVVIGWIGDSCWALASGFFAGMFGKGGAPPSWGRWASGCVFIALGLLTAFGSAR